MTATLRTRTAAALAALVVAAMLVMGSCGYPGRSVTADGGPTNCITCHG